MPPISDSRRTYERPDRAAQP
ncbi:hypothetical protein [Rhizobium nepotum]